MKKFLTALSLFLLLCSFTYSQSIKRNAPYLSFHGGDFIILSDNFKKFYNTKNGFMLGLSVGLAMNNYLTLDGSISYYEKQASYKSDLLLNNFDNAILKQVLFSAGFQIHLIPNSIINLSLLSGISFAVIDEERKNSEGQFTYEIEGTGNFGVYGGLNFEVSFGKNPIAVFAESRYHYSWNPILEFDENYKVLSLKGGIKFYFFRRWR